MPATVTSRQPVAMKATILLALSLALAATGCGTSASSLCADQCECEGCSETEEQECVDDVEDAEKQADDEGCSDQYSEFVSCYADQFECIEGEVDADGCNAEAEAYSKCLN